MTDRVAAFVPFAQGLEFSVRGVEIGEAFSVDGRSGSAISAALIAHVFSVRLAALVLDGFTAVEIAAALIASEVPIAPLPRIMALELCGRTITASSIANLAASGMTARLVCKQDAAAVARALNAERDTDWKLKLADATTAALSIATMPAPLLATTAINRPTRGVIQ